MLTSTVTYRGELRTEATHVQSGNAILTDAPTDNHGQGAYFSPTDLVATALASCIITTIGIKVAEKKIDLTGWRSEIVKHMENNPRRIGRIEVHIYFSPNIHYSDQDKSTMERIARECPVALSLHPDLKQELHFHYD
ncbi:MAG: OsmC family protein [Bacteroidota bacterium]|nr:OsmC family protein [Bacteroidota bacterium]MDX5431827.1 OsmC family protein [Bacteroidota bacterium]MDX5470540.1 OsmC family protein [Bacteroidota bacterium]